jgi:hypothetical protein
VASASPAVLRTLPPPPPRTATAQRPAAAAPTAAQRSATPAQPAGTRVRLVALTAATVGAHANHLTPACRARPARGTSTRARTPPAPPHRLQRRRSRTVPRQRPSASLLRGQSAPQSAGSN